MAAAAIEIDYSPELIAKHVLSRYRRVLLFGEPGIGKSTLATGLAQKFSESRKQTWCLSADPGTPAFGPPGAVSLGRWRDKGWVVEEISALCSLDAGRFRLPLVNSVRYLAQRRSCSMLLIDAPGVVRGVASSELLMALVEAAAVDCMVLLTRAGKPLPLATECSALGLPLFKVKAQAQARHPGKRARARERTRLWDAYLAESLDSLIEFDDILIIGTPPPIARPDSWRGRQVALLDTERTVVMGEVLGSNAHGFKARFSQQPPASAQLLVRNARRDERGLLNTAKPYAANALSYLPPTDIRPFPRSLMTGGPVPVARVGKAVATLVNGVFGDPLLHLRLRQSKRSLLFDLGEGSRLPGKIAHQVSDVFISHAHIDHIAGFLWLLRSRIGESAPIRLFGPPGLAAHIEGMICGIQWDRIGAAGPRFEIAELHGKQLQRFKIQAGHHGVQCIGVESISAGVVLDDPACRVRAITLDHGTPVLAFSFELPNQLGVRKEGLAQRGLASGPWLGKLKRHFTDGELEVSIRLPDGSVSKVGELGKDLLQIKAGHKLVYATDLADTPENRKSLVKLATKTHTFFCEATFAKAEVEQARRTGHLTTEACAEIANAAEVEHLVPFHFSRRYEKAPERIYDEIKAVCGQVLEPR